MTNMLYTLRNVTHGFQPGVVALDDVSTLIPKGGCTSILGCNGAGKSTLLHILAGLLTPTSGEVAWDGQPLSVQKLGADRQFRFRFRREVGIVFQDPDCQWLCDTVLQEVEYGPRQVWPGDEARERAAQVMVIMGINHLADRAPFTLSGGQKRRVALATSLSMDPSVLLLDEPTLSLDAATQDFLVEWLLEFIAQKDKTVILATHDLSLARELSSHAVVLTPCHKLARAGEAKEVLADIPFLQQMNLASRRNRVVV